MKTVSVLCARADSIYKSLPGCDVFDAGRNAFTFAGRSPVVAHPPCRLWGCLSAFANAENEKEERALALFCVDSVRKWGGYWSIQ